MKDQTPRFQITKEPNVEWIRVVDVSGEIHLFEKDGIVAAAITQLGALLVGTDIYSPVPKKKPSKNH